MKKVLILVPVLALVLFACEEDANIEIPETEPKLVLSCFLTPQDSILRARISKSNPIFNSAASNTGDPVTNATVILYGNSTSTALAYNANTQSYEVDAAVFSIIPGNEYHLVVTEPSGMQAEAFTTVPLSAPTAFQCTATDTLVNSDPWYTYGETEYTYSFNDAGGQANYYRFVAYNVKYDSISTDTLLEKAGWDIFNDENADGTTISRHSITWFSEFGTNLVAYDVWMMNCNYDYYTFHQSLYNYNGGGDPFSEPTLIYSNVTGGLGIFAAANSVHIRIPR